MEAGVPLTTLNFDAEPALAIIPLVESASTGRPRLPRQNSSLPLVQGQLDARVAPVYSISEKLQDAISKAAKSISPGTVCIFATDRPGTSAAKRYVVASLATAYDCCFKEVNQRAAELRTLDLDKGKHTGRYLYEWLNANAPMRLYYDAEYDPKLNPDKDPKRCVRILHGYIRRALGEILNIERGPGGGFEIVLETASLRDVKESFHGKLHPQHGVLANMDAQKTFWARVEQLAVHDLEGDDVTRRDEARYLRVKRTRGEGTVDDWFWDRGVYGKNQLMRMLGASAFPFYSQTSPPPVQHPHDLSQVSFPRLPPRRCATSFLKDSPQIVPALHSHSGTIRAS